MSVTPVFPPRPCAVCGGTDKGLLYQQRFSSFSGGLVEGYDVVVCKRCGFCFADRVPDQAAFDRYYAEMSKYEYGNQGGRESPYDLAKFQEIAALLGPYFRSREARILEVGCATGRLLGLVKEAGYPNVLGVDPSPACARAATALYGVPAITGTLGRLEVPALSQDFLILSGVLEHVRDLDAALRRLSQVLANGGRLHIGVPDASRYADGEDAPFQEFSVEHINFFGPDSLTNLLIGYGFKRIFWDQRMMTVNYRTTTPVVLAVFEKSSGDQPEPTRNPDPRTLAGLEPHLKNRRWQMDEQTGPGLRAYVEQCRRAEREESLVIDRLVASAEPIIVWGVGTHTQRLLAATALPRADIRAFVDSNAKYQGKELVGRPIVAPSSLQSKSEAILISSWMYQREIEEEIKGVLKLRNRVIKLRDLA